MRRIKQVIRAQLPFGELMNTPFDSFTSLACIDLLRQYIAGMSLSVSRIGLRHLQTTTWPFSAQNR